MKNKGYLGNKNLKRAGEQVCFSKKNIEEYKKCKEDVIYFAENYMKIVNLDLGLVNIPLYDYQKKMLTALDKERFVVLLAARQSGKCVCVNTNITVRNKFTGETKTIGIGEYHDKIKQSSKKTTHVESGTKR